MARLFFTRMKNENKYQGELKKRLLAKFPGSIVLKNDPSNFQGVCDLIILSPKGKWAGLEVKRSSTASHRPNQDYWVGVMDKMAFARFIYPENEREVLDELSEFFKA